MHWQESRHSAVTQEAGLGPREGNWTLKSGLHLDELCEVDLGSGGLTGYWGHKASTQPRGEST